VLNGVPLGPDTGNTSGTLGGGQIGCNYQFAPNWVIGIEGDGEAADIRGDVTESFLFVSNKYSADLSAFNEHIETSVTRLGWTVGGSVEWAFWDNWSAKVEYDYYDFSTRNLALPGTIAGVPEVVPGIDIKEIISTVKFGVNYRFY
jgi:outer membrane immunogenic protein